MQWDENKDVLMMREVLDGSILTHTAGSTKRWEGWQKLSSEKAESKA